MKQFNESLFKAIVANGERYRKEFLAGYVPKKLIDDWWEAFKLFLNRICMQGRRDSISKKVYERAVDVLAQLKDESNVRKASQNDWKDIQSQLSGKIGKGKVGKGRDIEMIISALQFVDRLTEYGRNIVAFSVAEIKAGKICQHYFGLQKSSSGRGILQVGPKVAAFYLRDVVTIFNLENHVSPEAVFTLQPIDTWVRQIAEELNFIDKSMSPKDAQKIITIKCREKNISAIAFNQGAWYTGFNSLPLLIEQLSNPK